MKKYLVGIVLAASLLCASAADAATCFWVGGTGTWSTTNTASWASSSGGTAGTCAATGGAPINAADTATFDGSSGAGTVTVDSTISGLTLTEISLSSASVSLDFSVNNPSLTLTGSVGFSTAGTNQTVNCGSGTFTLTGANNNVWSLSGTVTFNCASSTITLSYSGAINGTQAFSGGSKTYGTLNLNGRNTATPISVTGANTFASVNITGPIQVLWQSATTNTITNAFNWAGTSSSTIVLRPGSTGSAAIIHAGASSTMSWAALNSITFNTSSVTATNSFDNQSNSGVTITPPSGGSGGGHIIGG